jgi:hypothetical protein
MMCYGGTVARERAPKRTGHRTTLRLPDALAEAARQAAAELETTPNDAVVLFALEGAEAFARRRAIARRAEQRWNALLPAGDPRGPFPSVEEAMDAAFQLRRDLAAGR